MKNKIIIALAAIITIAIVVSAAFIYINMNPPNNTQNTVSVTDDNGFTTEFETVPQRIVSLAPSNTQVLYAIGVGDRVVGVTDYDKYPYDFSAWIAAGNMTSIGGFSTPNLETVASLNPDLILAANIHDSLLSNLRGLGYKVLTLNPHDVDSVFNDILMVGKATGADQAATTLVNSLTAEMNEIADKIAASNSVKPLVYYEVWYPPLMSAGSTSFINDVITRAGGINIFENESQQYPTVSSETIVQSNPTVILLPTNMGATDEPAFYGSVDQVKARPGWSVISAVQNNRVAIVNGDLFAEAGPRIVEQIEAAAKALYPEIFNPT
jgi:iron complex transport system substrate-binding protein